MSGALTGTIAGETETTPTGETTVRVGVKSLQKAIAAIAMKTGRACVPADGMISTTSSLRSEGTATASVRSAHIEVRWNGAVRGPKWPNGGLKGRLAHHTGRPEENAAIGVLRPPTGTNGPGANGAPRAWVGGRVPRQRGAGGVLVR